LNAPLRDPAKKLEGVLDPSLLFSLFTFQFLEKAGLVPGVADWTRGVGFDENRIAIAVFPY
jgi:hypothetical protein